MLGSWPFPPWTASSQAPCCCLLCGSWRCPEAGGQLPGRNQRLTGRGHSGQFPDESQHGSRLCHKPQSSIRQALFTLDQSCPGNSASSHQLQNKGPLPCALVMMAA
ncbi:ATP-binding cassette sub-family C member 11 [Manis javanica]|nr:ATP-binding cassette sub-family C member 11 [Manis javanica]